jgi:large subunit ribosomal protein L30
MSWMVVRVRGTIHAREEVDETLRHLHLTRPNHATVVPERPEFRGMLTRVQGYVTWGEADAETVDLLVRARGSARTGGRLAPAGNDGTPGATDVAEASRRVADSGVAAVPTLRPLFRLKAPKGGWRSTKKPFSRGGALGYRGRAINDLVRRMV